MVDNTIDQNQLHRIPFHNPYTTKRANILNMAARTETTKEYHTTHRAPTSARISEIPC